MSDCKVKIYYLDKEKFNGKNFRNPDGSVNYDVVKKVEQVDDEFVEEHENEFIQMLFEASNDDETKRWLVDSYPEAFRDYFDFKLH